MSKTVYVGLSGGVDSSVTAALLKKQGYDVVGVYMKNWSQDLPGFTCPWKQDFTDAKRVAVQLDIPFKMFDFEKEYKQKVVDYMVAEYKAGRTPNPDVMCNQEVKFKLFLDASLEDGADFIATGHYAAVGRVMSYESRVKKGDTENKLMTHDSRLLTQLKKAKDGNKDQTYFLYRVTSKALEKTLFPLGEYTKPEVRELAKEFGLVTATKKESMGICFVGKVGIKDFLLNELGPQKPGDIIDQLGIKVGQHEGAIFYTIGQRHGLDVGGGMPYYVVGKNMQKNEVYVTTDISDNRLWNKKFNLTDVHWINQSPLQGGTLLQGSTLQVRTRHRAPLVDCEVVQTKTGYSVMLKDDIRALTPGQSAVLYCGDTCLGGGIIV